MASASSMPVIGSPAAPACPSRRSVAPSIASVSMFVSLTVGDAHRPSRYRCGLSAVGRVEDDIQQRRYPGIERPPQGAGKVGGPCHALAIAAQTLDDPVVPRLLRQVLRIHEGRAEKLFMECPHFTPGAVIAEDADERKLLTDGRIELEAVEAEGSV